MIGKVLRGGQVGGLVRCLYGPGRANEHLNPRIVAGWRAPERLEPAGSPSGGRDMRRLVRLLSEPAEAAGLGPKDRPVYHLVVASAKADAGRGLGADPALPDEVWAQIATDLMDRTGLALQAPAGQPARDGVRWVAVRHDLPGAEHVHIVATLATESGRRVSPRNDFYRLGEGCRSAEQTYGCGPPGRGTGPRRSGCRGPSREGGPGGVGCAGAGGASPGGPSRRRQGRPATSGRRAWAASGRRRACRPSRTPALSHQPRPARPA